MISSVPLRARVRDYVSDHTGDSTLHRPLVSIVIPSYNQGKFIKETIDSCLSQSYRPIEVVVIDAPVQHVNRLRPTHRAHPHLVVTAVEVPALD